MCSLTYDRLLEGIEQLSESEQRRLARELKRRLGVSQQLDADQLSEQRFSDGVRCPYCSSESVNRYGTYQDLQRYRCTSCDRTFTAKTATPMAGSHYPEKWGAYIDCMSQGLSLEDTAEKVDISVTTAFYWRHKVLSALRKHLDEPELQGVVEADPTYFLESQKGNCNVARDPRKRGGSAPQRGISRHQVCVLAARDRHGNSFCDVAGRGRLSTDELNALLGGTVCHIRTLCSDNDSGFSRFARRHDLDHEVLNQAKGERRRGLYHLNHVNSYHSRLKRWMRRFNGVATKYLRNYLAWFDIFAQISDRAPQAQKKQFMLNFVKEPVHSTTKNLLAA